MNLIELIWAQVKRFVAENNNTIFRLKDVKELMGGGGGGGGGDLAELQRKFGGGGGGWGG